MPTIKWVQATHTRVYLIVQQITEKFWWFLDIENHSGVGGDFDKTNHLLFQWGLVENQAFGLNSSTWDMDQQCWYESYTADSSLNVDKIIFQKTYETLQYLWNGYIRRDWEKSKNH
jgi:hypothetical protein